MDVEAIRDALREGNSPSLRRRRWLGRLSALGLADFGLISLYQLGAIRHLPDPPGKLFDSDRVIASEEGYRFGVPDGPVALTLHALTLILASAGGSRRSGRPRILDVMLGGVVLAGAVGAAAYLANMIRVQKRACAYCLAGAAINFAMVPLALPDLVEAALANR